MTRTEFNELGITEAQYEEMFGEKAVFDDEAATPAAETVAEATAESTIEVPEIAETTEEASTTEVAAETAEETVTAIVPAEAKAEVVATGAAMSFDNIKKAAEFLAAELNLKVSNTLDGLYKTKRRGSNKNHGYIVTFGEDKTVQLAKIAQ